MKKNKHNLLNQESRLQIKCKRRGFTLVEMLVSVALVIMMMVLFAQVFQSATGAMSAQKGISSNDQRSRNGMLIIRNDLRARTMRDVVPFAPNHKTAGFSSTVLGDRVGYLQIDEGNPNDPTDDSVQFTILVTIPKKLDSTQPELPDLVGRATMLKPKTAPNTDYDTLNKRGIKLRLNPNQPEYDDGQISPNDAGLSQAAEVCYFLRGTTLYRRVLLVRQPYDDAGSTNLPPHPNELPPGEEYSTDHVAGYGTTGVTGTGNFWHDFDYSAFYRPSVSGSSKGPVFHVWDISKQNVNPPIVIVTVASINYPLSLGVPHLRFGHSIARNNGTPLSYIGTASTSSHKYIGRYTLQETAHPNFGYPGRMPMSGSTPLDPHDSSTATAYKLSDNAEVTQFSDQTGRRGEDILMKNVFEFDIKVWDDKLASPRFVDLGNGSTAGRYGRINPASNYGNRYDTWHPALSNSFIPPYREATTGADGQPGVKLVDDDSNGTIDDATELGYPGSDDFVYPLKAIQITIRMLDEETKQMRQLTIVESLRDN